MENVSEQISGLDAASLEAILDNLDGLVYVSDIETYELIYMNAYGRQIWGWPAGRRCWEVLQKGQNGPCAFCTNDRLLDESGNPAQPYVWEFRNTVNGHWYQCRDQAIRWSDGRLVRLEIATDITERKELETELERAREQALAQARRDELTQLFNRRAFFEAGQRVLSQSERTGRPVSLVMFDLDHFKCINDRFGHHAGDEVLRQTAVLLSEVVRDADTLARIGGEEFAVLMPDSDYSDAQRLAERLRHCLGDHPFTFDGQTLRITASFGVSASVEAGRTVESLLSAADRAMYGVKQDGRDGIAAPQMPFFQQSPE